MSTLALRRLVIKSPHYCSELNAVINKTLPDNYLIRSFFTTRISNNNNNSNTTDDNIRKHDNDHLLQGYSLSHPECNVTTNIASRVGVNLHRQLNHPIHTIKTMIQSYFHDFVAIDDMSPIVSTQQNFDSLLVPPDHVSRNRSDTYYLTHDTVLRTHTSAHQTTLLQHQRGLDKFLVTGDVYRRDEIDSSHYPVFHQMEGVKMFSTTSRDQHSVSGGGRNKKDLQQVVETDLKNSLQGMAKHLFGNVEMRWVDAYFPFTEPSFELEIFFNDKWMEVLGCGVIQQEILNQSGRGHDEIGWAFGLGLERLAMVLFDIPDIRLFWSNDERFHKQFARGGIVKFEPYSKYPSCYKDISFWTDKRNKTASDNTDSSSSSFHPNDLHELVRNVAGDLVEKVELVDQFVHPKTNRTSSCFRIFYRSMDRSLTNEEIDSLQDQVRFLVAEKLQVELR